MSDHYDIIIVGGGLVGCSLAVALQNSSLRIALLEKKLPTAPAGEAYSRPISLSHCSYDILKQLAIWPDLSANACAIKTVHVSRQGAMGAMRFHAEQQKLSALGYVVPFTQLKWALFSKIQQQKNVEIIESKKIISLQCNDKGAQIELQTAAGKRKISAALLVGADGTCSNTRDLLGVAVDEQAYAEVGIAARVRFNHDHQHSAYERFTDAGIIAVLPYSERQCGLVWTMTQTQYQEYKEFNVQQWSEKLRQYFGYRCGKVEELEILQNYPLQFTQAQQQVGEGWVLLGNSAHTIYPIAAQGFNLGLRDVMALAQLLISAHQQGNVLGHLSLLQTYVEKRKPDQEAVLKLVQKTHRLFSMRMPFLKSLLGLGLLTTELVGPWKQKIAKRALGSSFSASTHQHRAEKTDV